MNTSNPKVTVVVSAYNHEKYILQCLEGIASQTFRDFEWIVVDDGSKDSTPVILKANQQRFGYKLILQENKGLSATLTMLYRDYAKGTYVSGCASDDIWISDKLEKQVKYMDDHPDCAFCYGDAYAINSDSRILGLRDNSSYKSGDVFDDIITKRFHPPVNRLTRLSVLKELNYYPTGIVAEDFYMDCKITYKYHIGYISAPLSYYRVAPMHVKRDPISLLRSHEDTINLYRNEPIYPSAISRHAMICFVELSKYAKYKRLSLKYLSGVKFSNFSIVKFSVGLFNLFFRWIKF